MTAAPKIAVAVRAELETWQKLNVVAFLTSGFATVNASVVGETYVDGSGREYTSMLAHPVRVFTGDASALARGFTRALDRGLLVSMYTDDMFATMNDADNRGAVEGVPTTELVLAGFAAVGDGKQVDKSFDKLKLHE